MIYAFKYRLPGTRLSCGSWSRRCLEQPEGKGFLISPFLPHSPRIFIPLELVCQLDTFSKALKENGEGSEFPFPAGSTSQNEYEENVRKIIRLEKEGKLVKCVAARCSVLNQGVDVDRLFDMLCSRYPNAFVFLFSTPLTGTWIGASPELLLENKEGKMRSTAIAGTRPAGPPGPWDSKNIEEQAIVSRYISKCFEGAGLVPEVSASDTLVAGPVEHLHTEIKAFAPDYTEIDHLLDALSPTPAICGIPRPEAAQAIANFENFDRAYYGGYCGPVYGTDDFNLYVNLRCGKLSLDKTAFYAGAGIMPESVPADEWAETERKIDTLKNIINQIL